MQTSSPEESPKTEPSGDLITEAEELIDVVHLNWDDLDKLRVVALQVVDFQIQLARRIADAELGRQKAFLNEYEAQYRKNVSEARAMTHSPTETRLKYEFEALKGLLRLTETRVKHLQFSDYKPQASQQKGPLPRQLQDASSSKKGSSVSSKSKSKTRTKQTAGKAA